MDDKNEQRGITEQRLMLGEAALLHRLDWRTGRAS